MCLSKFGFIPRNLTTSPKFGLIRINSFLVYSNQIGPVQPGIWSGIHVESDPSVYKVQNLIEMVRFYLSFSLFFFSPLLISRLNPILIFCCKTPGHLALAKHPENAKFARKSDWARAEQAQPGKLGTKGCFRRKSLWTLTDSRNKRVFSPKVPMDSHRWARQRRNGGYMCSWCAF